MSEGVTKTEPPSIHRDVYPVLRVSTEYYLRGFDVLSQMNNDVVSGLVFMTLWHSQLVVPSRKPITIRELSRKVDLPYETVRRHVQQLELGGEFARENGGLVVPAAVERRGSTLAMLRGIYVNAARLFGDLTRIGIAKFKIDEAQLAKSGGLSPQQMVVAVAGTEALLAGMKAVRLFFDGDLVKGLVFTAIWAANVKHVTNTDPAASRAILSDSQRLPVSILAISDSLRLPYETVRRHTDALVKDGRCVRIGRQGFVIPASTFAAMTDNALTIYKLVMALLAEVRAGGVKV